MAEIVAIVTLFWAGLAEIACIFLHWSGWVVLIVALVAFVVGQVVIGMCRASARRGSW